MKKPKKITVKFFLNRNLQHLEIEGKEHHPLYAQITYDRKNTQIKCNYGWFYQTMEHVNESAPRLLNFEESIFKRSVEYEIARRGDEFGLRGLGRIYEIYCLSIHSLFDSYMKLRLKKSLEEAQPKKFLEVLQLEKASIKFPTLYEAGEKLFDNFKGLLDHSFKADMKAYEAYHHLYDQELNSADYRFPVVIDWLDGSHSQKLSQALKNHYNPDIDAVKHCLDLVQRIVNTKIGLN